MGQSVFAQTLTTAESKKMAAMAFANYKRRRVSAANFAQKQELENKQFAADENKTVNRKWSCDEDGVHISTQWLPIPRVRTFSLSGTSLGPCSAVGRTSSNNNFCDIPFI